ncbi:hypothetical protein GGI25_003614 [Coemansia spiralis]|uniref:Uncharacterized protein n=2 Tax=Coemansia TaxID=4863 RepID=A0A9W8KXU6_9FUNG|nr:hypothetical protein BX070DRAFT_244724 [Coemansia spiralis]KAJ1996159.1 hypothetical protein EDC05_000049 [Coemansia umbellata]KAJ2626084.1 hypothetical protein GGI26_000168 [Coemansia sp. RSA 1358]KAJ2676227.1 hypothetical protein GGI25_003614 [Coemansia spiralis]
MGFLQTFYPDRKRDLRPSYKKHCNCDDCIGRSASYGNLWRHKTPVCTCCDCMAIAGQNIPHSQSTFGHTHAATHTCAMPGPVRHYPYPSGVTSFCDDPPPKYSMKPHTSHKVDEACGSKFYTTPLYPERKGWDGHVCAGAHPSSYSSSCSTVSCSCSNPSTNSATCCHREDRYLMMPRSYRPCNR